MSKKENVVYAINARPGSRLPDGRFVVSNLLKDGNCILTLILQRSIIEYELHAYTDVMGTGEWAIYSDSDGKLAAHWVASKSGRVGCGRSSFAVYGDDWIKPVSVIVAANDRRCKSCLAFMRKTLKQS